MSDRASRPFARLQAMTPVSVGEELSSGFAPSADPILPSIADGCPPHANSTEFVLTFSRLLGMSLWLLFGLGVSIHECIQPMMEAVSPLEIGWRIVQGIFTAYFFCHSLLLVWELVRLVWGSFASHHDRRAAQLVVALYLSLAVNAAAIWPVLAATA